MTERKHLQVLRTKNQFVLKEGDERGGYKACLLNLRFTDPDNATFGEMVQNNKKKWDTHIEKKIKGRHKANAHKVSEWAP